MENANKEQNLVGYVKKCLTDGKAHDEIKKQLRAVGWSEEQVDSAYAEGLKKYGVPAPSSEDDKIFAKKSSTAEIVVNFFSFILLGISATSLGILLYGVINYYFVDVLNSLNGYKASSSEGIHYAISSLVISFPLYFLAMKFWFKRFENDEGKQESLLTKWITYLVLLVSAITVLGDLIAVIYSMLQGEITVRFFLKALTIFIIAGGVFSFYFLERKKIQYKKYVSRNTFKIFANTASVIILIAIIGGFMASGSPKTERQRTFDNERENDLASLASCIGQYGQEYKSLPDSLEDLMKDSSYSYCASNLKDPETKEYYEYRVVTKSEKIGQVTKGEFELCANFNMSSAEDIYSAANTKWSEHNAGRSCDLESAVLDKETSITSPQ